MRGTEVGRDLDFGVTTWKVHCGQKRSRDIKLMSRHRVASRRVATWFGVVTWIGLSGVATPI